MAEKEEGSTSSQQQQSPSSPARVFENDEERLQYVDELLVEERLLEAARILDGVVDKKKLNKHHDHIVELAQDFVDAMDDLSAPPEKDWKKQGERHGKYDTYIHYKIVREKKPTSSSMTTTGDDAAAASKDSDGVATKLYCRIETPIEASLLVPLFAVLNEVELYPTWLPSFTFPMKLGVQKTERLKQHGRSDQTFASIMAVPWPFGYREIMCRAKAINDIDKSGCIVVRMNTPDAGSRPEDDDLDFIVPEPPKGMKRFGFDGAVLFRSCPADHPLVLEKKNRMKSSNKKESRRRRHDGGGDDGCDKGTGDPDEADDEDNGEDKENGDDEPQILVTLKQSADPKMNLIPQAILNFATRTVIGYMWSMLLQVAVDVKNGKRPKHTELINQRHDVYEIYRKQVEKMVHRTNKQGQQEQ